MEREERAELTKDPPSLFAYVDPVLWLVTAHHQDRDNGMIATWVTPASLAPERTRVVAAISKASFTLELIERSGRFAVQLLGRGEYGIIASFGLHSGRDIHKFAGIEPLRTARGLPLIEGTCGFAECTLIGRLDTGDRVVCAGEIVEQRVYPDRRPLLQSEAFARLAPELREELRLSLERDAERDRELIARFTAPDRPER